MLPSGLRAEDELEITLHHRAPKPLENVAGKNGVGVPREATPAGAGPS
jgi:hypothetical protein